MRGVKIVTATLSSRAFGGFPLLQGMDDETLRC